MSVIIIVCAVLVYMNNQEVINRYLTTATQKEAEKRSVEVIRTNFKENDTFHVAEKLLEKNAWKKAEEIR